jgi:hypothetical protein
VCVARGCYARAGVVCRAGAVVKDYFILLKEALGSILLKENVSKHLGQFAMCPNSYGNSIRDSSTGTA